MDDHVLTVTLSEREHAELTLTGELTTQLGFVRLRIALDTPTDRTTNLSPVLPDHEETLEEIVEHAARLRSTGDLTKRIYPLLTAGFIKPNEILLYETKTMSCGLMVNADGELITSDGRVFEFPSPAAGHARYLESGVSIATSDGWLVLRNADGRTLHEMREDSDLWVVQTNPSRVSYYLREDWAERAVKLRASQPH